MTDAEAPLFRRVLGDRFDRLPRPIREMHDLAVASVSEGVSEITRGRSVPARMIGWIARLPAAGSDIPVTVHFLPGNGAEQWRRSFGPSKFQTTLEASDRLEGHLIERLGPIGFLLEIPADDRGLAMIMRGMTVFGLTMPRILWPRIAAFERVVDGLFAFDVSVSVPICGFVIRYRGRLRSPQAARE